MIAPFSTGPTAFRAVVWDQAESDSFPQTPVGYYGCETAAMVPAWRAALGAPALPWVFVHLQPYTGSGPCCLEDLRASQLVALSHPATGVASAVDLGDPSSPVGNVHFRNKQLIGDRLATSLRFLGGDAAAAALYPSPAFLSQIAYNGTDGTPIVDVTFFRPGAARGAPALPLTLIPPTTACPSGANCTAFEILGSDGGVYVASAALAAGGVGLRVTAPALPAGVYAVGSAYAWSQWPLASLFSAGGLPVLPWRQALTMAGPPGPPAL